MISICRITSENKRALQDMVKHGTMLMGGAIVEERKKAKEKEKRRKQHIYDAVRHFREQASKWCEILRAVTNDDPSGDSDTNESMASWENDYLDLIN